MSHALLKLKTERFTGSIKDRFVEQPVTLAAARVTGATVAIGGHLYPGSIEDESGAVVNVGRPAAAIYAPSGGGGSLVSIRGGGGGGVADPGDIAAAIAIHAAQPDVHHPRVTAGNGISVSVQQVSINLSPNSGLAFDGSDRLQLGTPATISSTSTNNVTGASHVHAVTASNSGLSDPNHLAKFAGDGGMTFSRVTAQLINSTGGSVSLPPEYVSGDLVFRPGNRIWLLPDGSGMYIHSNKAVGSTFHVPGLLGSGWRIQDKQDSLGQFITGMSHLDIRSIYADELIVKSFIADMVRVRMGEDFLTYSMGIVTADNNEQSFVTPALNSSARLYIENSPDLAGELFSNGEWILLNVLNRTGGGLVKAMIWGQVSGYQVEPNNRQSWLFTTRQGTSGLEVGPGSLALSFGHSGAGYIHRTVVDNNSPFERFVTWSGANPYTPANRTVWVQVGNLNGVDWSPYYEPSGWGLYAQNAWLEGSVVAAAGKARLSNQGLTLQSHASEGLWSEWPYHVTFTTNPGNPSLSNTSFQIWGERYATSGGTAQGVIRTVAAGGTGVQKAIIRLDAMQLDQPVIVGSFIDLETAPAHSRIRLFAWAPGSVPTRGEVLITGHMDIDGEMLLRFKAAPAGPNVDLGTPGSPFRTIYVNNIVADTIAGEAMSGSIWQHDAGNMTIRSDSGSARTLFVANAGSGSMHLDVEGDITLGGSVDGVDVAGFKLSYDTHIANANAHHNQAHVLATGGGLGPDHTISGANAGWVLRASSNTTAAFAALQHTDLSNVLPDQHHNQVHVFATNAGLGADHTISGASAGWVFRASGATSGAMAQLQHNDLGGVTPNQHHNQVHDIVGSDHTIAGNAWNVVGAVATDTLGLIIASFDPGANERLLRSNSAGKLWLQSLGTPEITADTNLDIFVGSTLHVHGAFTVDTDLIYAASATKNVWINGGVPDGSDALRVRAGAEADNTLRIKKIPNQVGRLLKITDEDDRDLIILDEEGNLESGKPGFVSGLTGWQITATGNAEFQNGYFRGELHASIFVADELHASSGTTIFATAGRLKNTLTVTASGSHVIDLEDPTFGHAQIAVVGDRLRIKAVANTNIGGSGGPTTARLRPTYRWRALSVPPATTQEAAVSLTILDVWMQVTAVTDMGTHYRYTCTKLAGGVGRIEPGAGVVNYGQAGKGFVLATSDLNHAPYVDVFTTGAQPWNGDLIPHVRMGRLSGVGVLAATHQWGIVGGENLADNTKPYFVASNAGIELYKAKLTLHDGVNPTVQMLPSGDVKFGKDIQHATTTGFHFEPSTGNVTIGRWPTGNFVRWDQQAGSLSISGTVDITDQTIPWQNISGRPPDADIINSFTLWSQIGNMPVRFRDNIAPTAAGLYLSPSWMGFHNGNGSTTGWRTYMDANGNFALIGPTAHGLTWASSTGVLTVTGNIIIQNPWAIQTSTLTNNAGWTDNTVANAAQATANEAITKALEALAAAQQASEGGTSTFYQSTQPSAANPGDLWYNTSTQKLLRLSSSGVWQDVATLGVDWSVILNVPETVGAVQARQIQQMNIAVTPQSALTLQIAAGSIRFLAGPFATKTTQARSVTLSGNGARLYAYVKDGTINDTLVRLTANVSDLGIHDVLIGVATGGTVAASWQDLWGRTFIGDSAIVTGSILANHIKAAVITGSHVQGETLSGLKTQTGALWINPGGEIKVASAQNQVENVNLSGWSMRNTYIVGQQNGVTQVLLTPNGRIAAGPSQSTTLGANGIDIVIDSITGNAQRAYTFSQGGINHGGLYAFTTSNNATMYSEVFVLNKNNVLSGIAQASGGSFSSEARLRAAHSLRVSTPAGLRLQANSTISTATFEGDKVFMPTGNGIMFGEVDATPPSGYVNIFLGGNGHLWCKFPNGQLREIAID